MGLSRDITAGYPTDQDFVPDKNSFQAPLIEGYFNKGIISAFTLTMQMGTSLFGSVELEVGGYYTFLNRDPYYLAAGTRLLFVRGESSYTINLFGSSSSEDNLYYIYGVRIPLIFTVVPFSWLEFTAGIPFYLDYLDVYIRESESENRRYREFDFAPSLYFSVAFNFHIFQIIPQVSILNIRNPVSDKRMWIAYPALTLGVRSR